MRSSLSGCSGGARARQAALDLVPGHRAVARVVVGAAAPAPAAPPGGRSSRRPRGTRCFTRVGAVVAGAALDRPRPWCRAPAAARRASSVRCSARAGDRARGSSTLPSAALKSVRSRPALWRSIRYSNGSKMCARDRAAPADRAGNMQRQLLLEHQHARGNRRDDVVAGVHRLRQLRDVELLELRDRLEVAELELAACRSSARRRAAPARCRCARTPPPGPQSSSGSLRLP